MPPPSRGPNATPPTPSAAEVVTEYLTAYLSGNIPKARSMIGADFVFRAPLIENTATTDVFFAGADRKARYIRSFAILRQWENGDEVSTLYRIDVNTPSGNASMLMHEWHTTASGQIVSSVMLFDTAAPAARLLGDALTAPEA
jgi:hypothetical protein